MFRVLSDEEAQRVTRWQAPEIKGAVPIANTHQVATPVKLDPAESAALLRRETVQGPDAAGVLHGQLHSELEMADAMTQGQSTGSDRRTASVPLSSPSADMLQTSYDEGYARGYAEGNAELHQQSVMQLQALIGTLGKPALKVPDAELEQEVMALSLEIARLVLGRELETDATALAALVCRGIEHLPNATQAQVQVHLHPLDAAMLASVAQLPENVELVEDSDLKRSDCRIVSGASTVHGGSRDWLEILGAELGLVTGPASQDCTT